MKKLALSALVCALCVAPAYAATNVPIVFPKGSYCGSYTGQVAGKSFSLSVAKGQTIDVTVGGGELTKVVSPRGKSIYFEDNADGTYRLRTSQKGTYKFYITGGGGYADVNFCAS